jgi:hypothetical protein
MKNEKLDLKRLETNFLIELLHKDAQNIAQGSTFKIQRHVFVVLKRCMQNVADM